LTISKRSKCTTSRSARRIPEGIAALKLHQGDCMRKVPALVFALVLVAAACGSDDGAGESTTTEQTAAPASTDADPGGGTSSAPACALDRAPKFIGLFERTGEGTAAIDDYLEGTEMAVAEINAAGGVC